ncbi:MAG: PEP/pyruvate-binding domain-containing protein, partial [Myxococcota bacterium]
ATEYYSPDRRFILGAVSYYEGPGVYAYEISPYDTASAEMVTTAYRTIVENAFFGKELYFHPTSTAVDALVPDLPDDVKVITTEDLFAGIDYQPYNLGTTTGLLRFKTAEEVDGQYTPFRELVVLDEVPNDISITAGIVTGAFQTPLAHINVLSINRGTPNMGLRDAQNDPDLVALRDKWVELTVGPFDWSIKEITQAEADAWWEDHKPAPIEVPQIDDTVTDLRPVEDIIADDQPLADEIRVGLTRFGSKGTNYAALYDIGDAVPIQDAFVIPFHWYNHHMESNGLRDRLLELLADPQWSDPAYRAEQLEAFKVEIVDAPLDPDFLQAVFDQANAQFDTSDPTIDWRFRSSTNAEDLGTFTGAGIYNSQTGDPEYGRDTDAEDTVAWAIKTAWSNLWNPRAYEEREYYSIDQTQVGMALLTTPNFPQEEANGVAVTNNIFDTSGLEPAFYVNVQREDYEVVQPDLGFIPDAYLHFFNLPGSPVVYISHSNLIPDGTTVLTARQINDLGIALDAINNTFRPVYGNQPGVWYGMDVEFKFDDKNDPGGDPQLFIKQARPFPWNQ